MQFLKTIIIFFLPFALSAQNYYGGIPALFDDFSYTSTQFPIAGDSSNSLYGKNIWLTENGKTSSRAWHRYNWGDGDIFGKNSGVSPISNGVSLFAQEGFRFSDVTPIFLSGFLLKEGTYVSRVRMSALHKDTKSIEAFWLMSPDHYRFKSDEDSIIHYTEIDFEWNNWFAGPGEPRIHTTNIGALHSKKGLITSGTELRFFHQNSADQISDLGAKIDNSDEYYFENRWYYYLIRLDSLHRTTEYFIESAEEGNIFMKKTFGGSTSDLAKRIAPVKISEYYPESPLQVIYNIGISSNIKDSLLRADMKMDVDWFYFTPQLDVGIPEVLKEIRNFRSQNIQRINTLGIAMYHDITKTHTASIIGPNSISVGQEGKWIIEPSLKNTLYDIEFSYLLKTSSDRNDLHLADKRTISLIPQPNTTEIELKAIVKNFWTRESTTITKSVKVIP